jgi:hypothetical protein
LLGKLDGEGEVEGCLIVARDREKREVCARCLHWLWGRGRGEGGTATEAVMWERER